MLTQVNLAESIGKTVSSVYWPDANDISEDKVVIVFADGTFSCVVGSSYEDVTLEDCDYVEIVRGKKAAINAMMVRAGICTQDEVEAFNAPKPKVS
jgi:hypothetical protein